MARGYSQSRSEGPGYSEGSDRKSQPRIEYPSGLRADLAKEFKEMARTKSGEAGKAMSFMDDKSMSEIIDYVAKAVEPITDHITSNKEGVEAAKALLASKKGGTYPWDDFRELTNHLNISILTPEEVEEDAFDVGEGDYAGMMNEIMRYEFAEEVMSDSRGEYRSTNSDDDDANEYAKDQNRADFAKFFLRQRVEMAEGIQKELTAKLDEVKNNAVKRWLDLREKGNI